MSADGSASSAREAALALLDKLSLDSLETPLQSSREWPDAGDISATYARLADLIDGMADIVDAARNYVLWLDCDLDAAWTRLRVLRELLTPASAQSADAPLPEGEEEA